MTSPAPHQPCPRKTHMPVSGKQKAAGSTNFGWHQLKRGQRKGAEVGKTSKHRFHSKQLLPDLRDGLDGDNRWKTSSTVKAGNSIPSNLMVHKSRQSGCSSKARETKLCFLLWAKVSLTIEYFPVSLPWSKWVCRTQLSHPTLILNSKTCIWYFTVRAAVNQWATMTSLERWVTLNEKWEKKFVSGR